MSAAVLGGGGGGPSDKSLKLGLADTLRLAWSDEDLRGRLQFVLMIFAVYALGVHVVVPVPGVDPASMARLLEGNQFFALLNTIGGGAFKRLSILALGLGPYITSSIIMQVMSLANPKWKQEMQEGGEYARRQQNRRTRLLTLALCLFQGFGLLQLMGNSIPQVASMHMGLKAAIVVFWMAGSMFLLWLGEQVSERGIGNGVSLLIFAGIVISLPSLAQILYSSALAGSIGWWQVGIVIVMFIAVTWAIVYFTIAQRRIPIQHMRRSYGTKSVGGHTSYLPVSVNMAGVIPVIFAMALIYMPQQFAAAFPATHPAHLFMMEVGRFFSPNFSQWQGWVGAAVYATLIFGFTYMWNAMTYNVEDISNNLKKHGSYIPGVRPGKQTKDFLDGVISRVTFVGATFLAAVALTQFVFPLIAPVQQLGLIGGTSILIMVSVALETMRQIEANILVKQYD
ncbi:MAG: preprotein translocase subunit SecY [Fimbriimonadaceae bacterium]|nr:preprotein translocase subunit SecY [Fimbriimonadaceae bacterium]QYK58271.1 MAG: preprotein translocase subunit SecY [Fimbriimonadaceae bacterium]